MKFRWERDGCAKVIISKARNNLMKKDKHWPVNQIKIQVIRLEIFQSLGKTLGDIGLVSIPPAKTIY